MDVLMRSGRVIFVASLLAAIVWQTVAAQVAHLDMGGPTVSMPPSGPAAPPVVRLRLLHNGREIILGPEKPVLTMGRDIKCDLVIKNPHASRNHCRIELRRNVFMLVDKSTNGTHVGPDAEPSFLLKGGEFVLRGRGCLSFGLLGERELGDIIAYETL